MARDTDFLGHYFLSLAGSRPAGNHSDATLLLSGPLRCHIAVVAYTARGVGEERWWGVSYLWDARDSDGWPVAGQVKQAR
jgi:hypothetical protein